MVPNLQTPECFSPADQEGAVRRSEAVLHVDALPRITLRAVPGDGINSLAGSSETQEPAPSLLERGPHEENPGLEDSEGQDQCLSSLNPPFISWWGLSACLRAMAPPQPFKRGMKGGLTAV